MAELKVIMVPISGPGDVLRIQEIVAEVLKASAPGEVHEIRCGCGSEGCRKSLRVQDLPDGRTILGMFRGADVVVGITLDRDGRRRLIEELGGTAGGA